MKKRKDEKSAKKKGAPPKSTGIVDSSPAPSNSPKTKLQKIAAKGSPGTHQSSKVDGKAITFKATEETASRLIKRASHVKTTETVLHHPAGSKKQKKSSTDDAVEAKGIADGTHQSSKVDGKAIALKATEGKALSSAKRASAIKTSKKQKKSLTNDAVEAKGIGDSSSVLTISTKSKKGTTAPTGPPVMLHSGKTVGKAIASNPNRIEHVPGENH